MAGAGGLQPRWKLNDIENELKTTTMENKQPELTRGEEEIMQILWRLGDAVVNEIIAQTKEPRPKYTTVATFLKILENKGFVNHTPEGKSHRYYPAVSREEYARGVMSSVLSSYFDGSLAQMVSFFSRQETDGGDAVGRRVWPLVEGFASAAAAAAAPNCFFTFG